MYKSARRGFCSFVKNNGLMNRTHFITSLFIFLSVAVNVFGQLKADGRSVGQRTFSFEDKSRGRKLITEVWYPTQEKPSAEDASPFVRIPTARGAAIYEGTYPLILFSHGTGGGRLTVEWFCAGLASRGFIVAAVDHFGNTFDNPIPVEFVKFWERPQDVRYVLDQLLSTPEIASSIDPNKIGVSGFSLGGFTSIALAGATMDYDAIEKYLQTESGKKEAEIPEMPGLISFFGKPEIRESFKKAPQLNDKRIKSVFVMSPAIGQTFPAKENFKNVTAPVYIVAAANDQMAPLKTNAAHYAKMIGTSLYKTLGDKAGHYVFLNEANDGLKKEIPMLFDDPSGVDRKAIHEQTLQLAVEHFRKTLK
jgi:predicted dienelactone hydrolase